MPPKVLIKLIPMAGIALALVFGYSNCSKTFHNANGGASENLSCLRKTIGLKATAEPTNQSDLSVFTTGKLQLGRSIASTDSYKGSTEQLPEGTALSILAKNECLRSDLSQRISQQWISSDQKRSSLVRQAYSVKLSKSWSFQDLSQAINLDPCILGVTYEHEYQVTAYNDPNSTYQIHQEALNDDVAYQQFYHASYGISNQTVKVAIIDTGVDTTHPDLSQKLYQFGGNGAGVNVLVSEGDPDRYNLSDISPQSHGTHMAGIVAASANNGVGVYGIAPFNVEIMAIGVFRLNGSGVTTTNSSLVYNAMEIAIQNNVDIVNLSLGKSCTIGDDTCGDDGRDILYEEALKYAVRNGVFVSLAAGNSTTGSPQLITTTGFTGIPARYGQGLSTDSDGDGYIDSEDGFNGIMTVGSIASSTGELARYSFYSPTLVEIMAYGSQVSQANVSVGIYSTVRQDLGSYGRLEGTSMAAPMVAGAAAMIQAWHLTHYGTKLTPKELEIIMAAGSASTAGLSSYVASGRYLDLAELATTAQTYFPRFKGDQSSDELPILASGPGLDGTCQ